MNIIYPPLVEQSIQFHFPEYQSTELPKAEMYRMMVERGIITENGMPTEYALENGLVKDYYEEENLSFEEFLMIYPYFERYDADLFQNIDGFWEMPLRIKEEILQELSSGNLDYDEKMQVEEYLADR